MKKNNKIHEEKDSVGINDKKINKKNEWIEEGFNIDSNNSSIRIRKKSSKKINKK